MAQFGGNPVNFPETGDPNSNPRRTDPEVPAEEKPGTVSPPNTGKSSNSEAARLARRGGQVAPPPRDEKA